MIEQGHELHTSDLTLSDGELGWTLAWGTAVGVPVIYVATVLVALAAGAALTSALAMSVWPAIVGGPFFGVLAGLLRLDLRHHGTHPHLT